MAPNYIEILVGGFNPSENISQLGLLFPIYGKTKNVPNHQPEYDMCPSCSPSPAL
jgi:hypothetical protein